MEPDHQNNDHVPPMGLADVPEGEVVDDASAAGSTDSGDKSLRDRKREQDEQLEKFAVEFLKKVMRLRGVQIERSHFLKSELHKRGVGSQTIEIAITESPAAAGVTQDMLDEIAHAAIDFETRKSSALSFAAGLPGGWALAGTVPIDLLQYFGHAFRVMQKLAYTYGWKELLSDTDEVDDETLGQLTLLLGVMLGVGGAAQSLSIFTSQVAGPAIQKNITKAALTKTSWYPVMKQTLRLVGINVTKSSFAKTVTKIVPVVGGVLSGGLTFIALRGQSKRLMQHLRTLPPPNVDAEEYFAGMQGSSQEKTDSPEESGTGSKTRGLITKATRKMRRTSAGDSPGNS